MRRKVMRMYAPGEVVTCPSCGGKTKAAGAVAEICMSCGHFYRDPRNDDAWLNQPGRKNIYKISKWGVPHEDTRPGT